MKRATAVIACLAVACAVLIWHARLGPDFWPPDRSFVGPNLVAALVQSTIILIAAVLLWPPTRRRIHAFADRKLDGLHSKIDALHDRHDQHTDHLDRIGKSIRELHDKIDQLDGK